MQLELMKDKHRKFLKDKFDLTEEQFIAVCDEDGDAFDKLFDDLTWLECDAADEFQETGEYSEEGQCAIDLIDIICGPYDEHEEEFEQSMAEL